MRKLNFFWNQYKWENYRFFKRIIINIFYDYKVILKYLMTSIMRLNKWDVIKENIII